MSTTATGPSPAIETIPRGASLHRFLVDGRNILLSLPHPALHSTRPHPYFGETIGRVCNRVENGLLHDLNGGKSYDLDAHNKLHNHHLHGGKVGWGKRDWQGPAFVRRGKWDQGIVAVQPAGWTEGDGVSVGQENDREGVAYELESWDGEEGFPGKLRAWVWYFEGRGPKGEVVLDVEYEAKFAADDESGVQETVVAMTNHSYFNLNGAGFDAPATLDHHTASLATPMHQTTLASDPGIPDGTLSPHPNVPATANTPFPLKPSADAETVPVDHCFVLDPAANPASSIPLDTRPRTLTPLISLRSAASGISLRVESTEPAFQFYTGAFIDVPGWEAGEVEGEKFAAGVGYGKHAGLCIEPSRFVNAAGRKEWRGMVLLQKGEVFGARSRYWAWKE